MILDTNRCRCSDVSRKADFGFWNGVGAGFIPARAMALEGGDKPRPYIP
jgi:hypothetical protein